MRAALEAEEPMVVYLGRWGKRFSLLGDLLFMLRAYMEETLSGGGEAADFRSGNEITVLKLSAYCCIQEGGRARREVGSRNSWPAELQIFLYTPPDPPMYA